jgi:hypothetical protein
VAAEIHPVAQVFLRPDHVALEIHVGRRRRPLQAVAILRLEHDPKIERLVARRKLHRLRADDRAHRRRIPAVDLIENPLNRFGVSASVHPVPQVFLRPDDAALEIDEGRDRRAPQVVAVFDLERLSKVEGLAARRKLDRRTRRLGTEK